MRLFSCDVQGSPRKLAPYLWQTASARLESSPCILRDQSDSEEQSNQPNSEGLSDQAGTGGQSHPNSVLENFFIDDWYRVAPDLEEKAEATERDSFGEEVHVMNSDLA